MYEPVIDIIQNNSSFILTSHETPDCDGLGSEYALCYGLRKLGKKAVILNSDPMPDNLSFLDPTNDISIIEENINLPENMQDSILILLDTNDINNIGRIKQKIYPNVKDYFIIDHHEHEGNDRFDKHIMEKGASSTSEIVYELLIHLNVHIDFNMAQALYAGIVFDTGSFIYPKTTERTFFTAYQLLGIGVYPNYIYSQIYESHSISSLVLQSRILSKLELYFEQHVAVLTMGKQELAKSDASYEEAASLINIPLRSKNILVSIFFKENTEGILRCSLRSKGNIDVAAIAQSFGGGGHKTAAGFKCTDTLDKTKKSVLEKLKHYFT